MMSPVQERLHPVPTSLGLQNVAAYTFRQARTAEERRAAYGLRHRTFVEEKGWWSNGAKTIESDVWDEVADLFVALNAEHQVVGTVRVLPDSSLGFQFDEMGLMPSEIDRTRFIEVSRMAVEREARGGQSTIMLGLCRALFEIKLQEGYTHWGGLIVTPLVHMLERIGMRFPIQTPPFMDYGAERSFVIASESDTVSCMNSPRVERVIRGHHINPAPCRSQDQQEPFSDCLDRRVT
jgi:N-acyl-L-homoserine lactone synthetase